jgi:predicted ATP-grasp superfamily ATP-dependent carboligase
MAPSFASAAAPGRVLVTDGEFKHTLGIVRQLARRGHEVHVIARSRAAPAVHSRAVRRWHRAPAPGAPDYDARLLEVARALAPVSLVPVGNGAVAAADRLRERLPSGAGVALPTRDALCVANDKARTADFARRLGLRTPRERNVASVDDARRAWRDFGAPLVLKSAREEGVKTVRYAREEAGIPAAFEAARAASGGAVLAQEFVAGDGYGFSALYWNGTLKRSFMHRRVREWPPSGGTSACAESLPEAPALAEAGRALLDALRWHGVAMVEFKGTLGASAPGLALIEINAKFWGSHDLALSAGVDFPGDLVALLEGRGLGPAPDSRKAVRFAWPFGGDLWHGLFHPASLPAVLRDALSSRVAHSYRLDDPLPLVFEIAQWARSTPGAWREHRTTR